MKWSYYWWFQSISLACLLRFTTLWTNLSFLQFSISNSFWELCISYCFSSQCLGTLSTIFWGTFSFNYFIGISLKFWYIRYSLFDLFCYLGFYTLILTREFSLSSSLLPLKIYLTTKFYHLFFSFSCSHSSSSLISFILASAPIDFLENPKLDSTYFITFSTEKWKLIIPSINFYSE